MKNIALVIALLCSSFPVNADFKAAADTYKKVIKEFLPLAENGDHRAMYALGSYVYATGHGFSQ